MKKLICLTISVLVVFLSNAQTMEDLLKKGMDLTEKKKYKEAIEVYNQAWKKDSTNYRLLVLRGNAFYESQDAERAFYDYTKAIAVAPDSAEAYHHRAIILSSLLMTDESILDNSMAIQLATNDTMRMVSYMNRGVSKGQKRDFQGAYEDYSHALQYDTTNIGAMNNIATVLDELGRKEEAVEYLKKIIRIDPKFLGGYVNLGFQYSRNGRYKESIDYFNKALELEKDEPITLNNRGFSKYNLKDYAGALADINKSISIYPGNSYAYKNRALVYFAQKQNEKACADLQKAIAQGFTQMYGDEVNELIKEHCK
jgi:tetratricopeptide (TPR) repeat protein